MSDDEDDEVSEQPQPELKPKRKPIFVSEMAYELMCEAVRLRDTQACLVKAGLRDSPWPEAMRRADVFEASAKLLDEIAPRLKDVMALVRERRRK